MFQWQRMTGAVATILVFASLTWGTIACKREL